ncbi:hypothetical protein ElyMa_000562600 [Elysia marginata]|uniref:Uncharacterized protein n=1 Tax=Elysia marginata TaxID=1093978 RepID=A0AAV4G2X8_9GAST|nr:hypothetical protein ElyMa_000562600 [Elysia marginata]
MSIHTVYVLGEENVACAINVRRSVDGAIVGGVRWLCEWNERTKACGEIGHLLEIGLGSRGLTAGLRLNCSSRGLNSPDTSGPRSGGTYRPQSEYRQESRDYSREDGEHFQREGNQDAGKPPAAWVCLENACQKRWETLHEWADRLRDIGKQILKWNRDAALIIKQRLVMRFCLWGLDKDAGRRVFERGPPPTLDMAVEEMDWFRKANSTFVGSNRESKVCRGGWSLPGREYRPCRDRSEGRAPVWKVTTGLEGRDMFLRKKGIGSGGRNLTTRLNMVENTPVMRV